MLNLKANSNYIRNSNTNVKEIKAIVQALSKEKENTQPHDFICRNFGRRYAETNHRLLNLPGIFKQSEDSYGFTSSGKVVYLDGLETILPDGENIPEEVAGIIEYLTKKLGDEKVEALYYYASAVINKLHKNYIFFVVTNYDEGVPQKVYNYKSMSIVVNFIFFGEKEIYEILNTLSEKDYINTEMSEDDFYRFIQAIYFVKKPYAKDFIEKSVNLFISIEKISDNHQLDLFLALKLMIKHYFKDDKEKLHELITMIVKATNESVTNKVVGYEGILRELDEKNQEIDEMSSILSCIREIFSKNKSWMDDPDFSKIWELIFPY